VRSHPLRTQHALYAAPHYAQKEETKSNNVMNTDGDPVTRSSMGVAGPNHAQPRSPSRGTLAGIVNGGEMGAVVGSPAVRSPPSRGGNRPRSASSSPARHRSPSLSPARSPPPARPPTRPTSSGGPRSPPVHPFESGKDRSHPYPRSHMNATIDPSVVLAAPDAFVSKTIHACSSPTRSAVNVMTRAELMEMQAAMEAASIDNGHDDGMFVPPVLPSDDNNDDPLLSSIRHVGSNATYKSLLFNSASSRSGPVPDAGADVDPARPSTATAPSSIPVTNEELRSRIQSLTARAEMSRKKKQHLDALASGQVSHDKYSVQMDKFMKMDRRVMEARQLLRQQEKETRRREIQRKQEIATTAGGGARDPTSPSSSITDIVSPSSAPQSIDAALEVQRRREADRKFKKLFPERIGLPLVHVHNGERSPAAGSTIRNGHGVGVGGESSPMSPSYAHQRNNSGRVDTTDSARSSVSSSSSPRPSRSAFEGHFSPTGKVLSISQALVAPDHIMHHPHHHGGLLDPYGMDMMSSAKMSPIRRMKMEEMLVQQLRQAEARAQAQAQAHAHAQTGPNMNGASLTESGSLNSSRSSNASHKNAAAGGARVHISPLSAAVSGNSNRQGAGAGSFTLFRPSGNNHGKGGRGGHNLGSPSLAALRSPNGSTHRSSASSSNSSVASVSPSRRRAGSHTSSSSSSSSSKHNFFWPASAGSIFGDRHKLQDPLVRYEAAKRAYEALPIEQRQIIPPPVMESDLVRGIPAGSAHTTSPMKRRERERGTSPTRRTRQLSPLKQLISTAQQQQQHAAHPTNEHAQRTGHEEVASKNPYTSYLLGDHSRTSHDHGHDMSKHHHMDDAHEEPDDPAALSSRQLQRREESSRMNQVAYWDEGQQRFFTATQPPSRLMTPGTSQTQASLTTTKRQQQQHTPQRRVSEQGQATTSPHPPSTTSHSVPRTPLPIRTTMLVPPSTSSSSSGRTSPVSPAPAASSSATFQNHVAGATISPAVVASLEAHSGSYSHVLSRLDERLVKANEHALKEEARATTSAAGQHRPMTTHSFPVPWLPASSTTAAATAIVRSPPRTSGSTRRPNTSAASSNSSGSSGSSGSSPNFIFGQQQAQQAVVAAAQAQAQPSSHPISLALGLGIDLTKQQSGHAVSQFPVQQQDPSSNEQEQEQEQEPDLDDPITLGYSPQEHAAATKIQALQRGRMVRTQQRHHHDEEKQEQHEDADEDAAYLGPSSKEHAAATKIQALQRGRMIRNRMNHDNDDDTNLLGPSSEQHLAASKIQALARGRATRAKLRTQTHPNAHVAPYSPAVAPNVAADENMAAARIQAIARGHLTRKELKQQHAAAAKIQAVQKGRLTRKQMKQQQQQQQGHGSDTGSSTAEVESHTNQAVPASSSSSVSPSAAAAADDADAEQAASRIQAIARGHLVRKELKQQHMAASKIQAIQRGRLTRKQFQQQQKQTDDMPNNVAAAHDASAQPDTSADLDALGPSVLHHQAATKIQAVVRGRAIRNKLKPVQHDAHDASQAADDSLPDEDAAAARIQAIARGHLARKQVKQQHEAAAKIQALQKGRLTRKQLKQKQQQQTTTTASPSTPSSPHPDTDENAAAARIQAIARGHLTRKELKQQHAAAAKIQAVQKGRLTRKQMKQQQQQQQGHSTESDAAGHSDPSHSVTPQPAPHHVDTVAKQQSAVAAEEVDSLGPSSAHHAAAAKIQALQRGRSTRKQLQQKQQLQTSPHSHIADTETQRQQEVDSLGPSSAQHAAATKIQALQRGRMVRTQQRHHHDEEEEQQEDEDAAYLGPSSGEHAAATKIQALQRGRMTRQQLQERKSSPHENVIDDKLLLGSSSLQHEAATKIQALARGRSTRKTIRENGKATTGSD